MKMKLFTATNPALFIVPELDMLLVEFKTLFDVVLSRFGIPLCGTDGKITHCWMKLKSSGDLQSVAKGECVNDWEKQAEEDPSLCFLERRHVDRSILRMKTIQNLTTLLLFTELKRVLF